MSDGPAILRPLFVDHAAVLGGAELSLLDVAGAHRERGAVALFEDGPFRTALERAGVRVHVLRAGEALRAVKKESRVPSPAALLAALRAVRQLAALARGHEVLWANSPKSFLVSAAAGQLARRPVVWHLRDILSREHFSAVNLQVMTSVANAAASRVVANSAATGEAFVAAGGRRALVRVVHNGIDAAPFDAAGPAERARARQALGVPDGAWLVGSFSRLHPWKGQRVLLDALERLPGVHAIVVGGALFSGEAAYEAELRARVASAPLAERVQLLGARSDVPVLLAACDMVVHSSTLPEPFGRVLVEALLSHRPLVASDAGGVREVVRHGETALLVAPGDAAALAGAIDLLRRDPALAARLAGEGARDVRHRFSREAMLAGVGAVLAELAPARGAGGR